MTEDFESNHPLIELFQEELRGQVNALEQALMELESKGQSATLMDELIRQSHSIKGAARIIKVETIIELSHNIEEYFTRIKGQNLPIDKGSKALLDESIKILKELSNTPSVDFQTTVIRIKNRCKELCLGYTDEHETNDDHPPVNSDQDLELDQFINELKISATIINKGLAELRSNFENPQILEQLINSATSIKRYAKSLNLSIVVEVSEALEKCFEAAFNRQLIWTQGHMDLLVESAKFIQGLSQCTSINMTSWLSKKEKNIEAIASVLLAISREASAIPPSQFNAKSTQSVKTESIDDESEELNNSFALDASMFDLFYGELDQRVIELNEGIIALENQPDDKKIMEGLMRAAHSLKGAARIVDLEHVSRLAHILEEFFTALQEHKTTVTEENIDALLLGVDLFSRLSQVPYQMIDQWIVNQIEEIDEVIKKIDLLAKSPEGKIDPKEKPEVISGEKKQEEVPQRILNKENQTDSTTEQINSRGDSFLRVSASNLNRLMGLAGESLVESKWLPPFCESLNSLKRNQGVLSQSFNKLHEYLMHREEDPYIHTQLQEIKEALHEGQLKLNERLSDLDLYMRRHSSLSDRLYTEVIQSRMRPFADGTEAFPRLIRGISKQLQKKTRLQIIGKSTPVDREILEKLEAPLNHLLRNAIDHGIEAAEERLAAGKSEVGTITLEASHKAGMLSIVVADDGKGVDLQFLKNKIIDMGFVTSAMAEKLNESELLEFMFLPGFSTSSEVTDISGRGVGLNVVQNMIQEVGGSINASLDNGMVFQLLLPLTLSVIRAMLVEIGNEPYAFPLARLSHVLIVSKEELDTVENRHYFAHDGKNIGLVQGTQILDQGPYEVEADELFVVVVTDHMNDYGIIVDRFLGEKELVVQELDPVLGKVPDISGGAFMEDGSPILIIDVEDMVRTIDKILSKGSCSSIEFSDEVPKFSRKKRILVVDDSVTVREVESRLLENRGYDVDSAINGVDGCNAIKMGEYDLVITDVDMPRMNGIEFVKNIRLDSKLQQLPIMIVSYKEREEDRINGLNAGANYYLTKSSFHDESLISAVRDLIGEP